MKQDERDERHAQIQAAAFALLKEQGYRKTSMLAIAKRAQASNQTLYAWYSNKQALFRGIIEDFGAAVREQLQAELRRHFRPEFLNRVDEIVVFHPLRREHILRIVDVQWERIRERLSDRSIDLVLEADARELIAEAGYDPVFGARPLKRALQRLVLDPLAREILSGNIPEKSTVHVRTDQGRIVFDTVSRVESDRD